LSCGSRTTMRAVMIMHDHAVMAMTMHDQTVMTMQ
jgi:hypothetical protein